MLSSKAPANWTTTPDVKLFAIKLSIVKATSMDIEYIILITNFLGSSRKTVNLFCQNHKQWTLFLIFVFILFSILFEVRV